MAKPWKIPHLDPDESLPVCLKKILRVRFREMLSYEDGTIDGSDIEALHDMRVASRRVQAILKIFSVCFEKKAYRKNFAKIRTVIRALGDVRERDVFIDMLEKYRKTLNDKEGKVIDLLIARHRVLREKARKSMLYRLKRLDQKDYKDEFRIFIETSL
jgi:CHAD domain-containing protein